MKFSGRKLLIATMHQKEKAIANILERELGVECIVPENFNTDLLGTFSGEVERKTDPLTTAKIKCLTALDLFGYDLAVASEGSFGPHPVIPFAVVDDEFLVFTDLKNELEISVRKLSTTTNFHGASVKTTLELEAFAQQVQFPSHAVILKQAKGDLDEMEKGIQDWETLRATFRKFQIRHGSAWLETDMRAHLNPTRMQVIEKATQKLADKINSQCPICQTSGFGVTEVREGLPCGFCGAPTRSTLSMIYSCQKCTHKKEDMYPRQKLAEDPMFCDICNP